MHRLACVNVAALPLQILLRFHPEWVHLPVAVVESDRPQAFVLYLNARAYKAGIRPGQRYAAALALANDLRAGAISRSQIEGIVDELTGILRRYSPSVEPASGMPGVFWLDVQGLEGLYSSLRGWADAVRNELVGAGMEATVAVGFNRFGVYALAMSHKNNVVCGDAAEERVKVQRVQLGSLNFHPEVQDRLLKLGVVTVGDFLRLPAEGIRMRFGAEADAAYQLAAGSRWAPLQPVPAKELHQHSVYFDFPETNAERLIFVIKRILDGIVAALVPQAQAIVEVTLEMDLDDRTRKIESVRSAAPTLDVAQFLSLIYLRLNSFQLAAGIVTLRVTAGTCPADFDQRRLFPERRRDIDAANQALARIRAEFGEQSVVCAQVCDAHLPAARFSWKPLINMPPARKPRVIVSRPLVRRIYAQPLPLQRDLFEISALEISGPYILSGGWWESGTHREYYFIHASNEELLWVFYDRLRRRCFLQGQVQ